MRPYYTDPYTVTFDANVVDMFQRQGQPAVILDASYFYPTSGGQEHDTGFINDVTVVDVVEEDEKIVHILSGEVNARKAHCRINWDRRFENMQQHTGQHILSAAFENIFDIQTVSSRLGEEVGTIDLSRQPTSEEIDRAIIESNRIVRENRDVVIHFADRNNIGSFTLRKPPKVEGTVRIVEVKDFDFSPCGGTHCTRTSEVGVILTGNVEKVKASLTRIEFYCGKRAIARYYDLHDFTRESARLLSSPVENLPAAVEKLKSLLQEKDSQIKTLSERLLKSLCDTLRSQVDGSREAFTVVDLTENVASADELRYVASCVSRQVKKSFAFHRQEGNICQMNLNLSMGDKESTDMLNDLRNKLGVKGGGRNGFFSLNFESQRLVEVVGTLQGHFRNG